MHLNAPSLYLWGSAGTSLYIAAVYDRSIRHFILVVALGGRLHKLRAPPDPAQLMWTFLYCTSQAPSEHAWYRTVDRADDEPPRTLGRAGFGEGGEKESPGFEASAQRIADRNLHATMCHVV